MNVGNFSEGMLLKNCSFVHDVLACCIVEVNGRAMVIRDAVETDLEAIVEIYNSTIASRTITADLEPISVESRLAWFHSHTPDKRPLWVIESEAEVVGWLGFQCFYSARRAYDVTAEISIYIAPAYRRQGIGRKLIQHAIAQCPKLHIKNLVGCIFATNKASLKLFENFGFEQWGFLPAVAEFEHETCDLVIMGRRIEITA
ncbi:MAG: GNAT family N-acetyltransferase [Leptolyngbyaceae cyanobacterium bins.302]|nr:GNAT family N-acetyltransferase [Leptolyngbyaceae cyanobacterium bins.302]